MDINGRPSGNASKVSYDNSSSGLTGDTVQDALDEINSTVALIDDVTPSTTTVFSSSNTESKYAPASHTHVSADITDLSTTTVPEGTNLYYTEARVSANTDVANSITHIADATLHRIINDAGTSATELWSANKIDNEITSRIANVTATDIDCLNAGGAAYTSVQHMQDIFHSSGYTSGATITDNLDGTISVSAGEGFIRNANSSIAPCYFIAWPANPTLVLANTALNYIGVEWNAGTPQIYASTSEPNGNDQFELATVYRDGTTLHITRESTTVVGDHAYQMILRSKALGYIKREEGGGALVSEVGTRNIAISIGRFWIGLVSYSTNSIDTSVSDTFTYHYNSASYVSIGGQTQINNLQYDNAGTLTDLGNNQYGVHFVYLSTDSDVHVIYGTDSYALQDAEEVGAPSIVPALFEKHAILIAKIIIQKNNTSFTSIISNFASPISSGASGANIVNGTGTDESIPRFDSNGNTLQTSNVLISDTDDITGTGFIHPAVDATSALGDATHQFTDLFLSGELKLSSTTLPLRLPNLSTTTRDGLTATTGQLIYNSTTNTLDFWDNTTWKILSNTTHENDATLHRIINDAGTSATELWSANKIDNELSFKIESVETIHPPVAKTTNADENGYIAQASTEAAGGDAWRAFNKETSLIWASTTAGAQYNISTGVYEGGLTTVTDQGTRSGEWLQLTLPLAPIMRYTIDRNVNEPGTPNIWYIAGSNDGGTTWTELDNRSGESISEGGTTFTCATPGSYADVRIIIEQIVPGNGWTWVRLAEWTILSTLIDIPAHTHVSADITDLSTTTVPEGTNLYYTEARVSANTDVANSITHIADATLHRIINDTGTSATELWSANKINLETNRATLGKPTYLPGFAKTTNADENGYSCSASTEFDVTAPAWKVFDETNNSAWASSSGLYTASTGLYVGAVTTTTNVAVRSGEWLELVLPSATIAGYNIAINSLVDGAPRKWYLAGSNDGGTTWNEIDTRLDQTIAENPGSDYKSTTPAAYTRVRLIVEEITSGAFSWVRIDAFRVISEWLPIAGLDDNAISSTATWSSSRLDSMVGYGEVYDTTPTATTIGSTGTWILATLNGSTANSLNTKFTTTANTKKLTYLGTSTVVCRVSCNLSFQPSTSDNMFRFALFKNSVQIPGSLAYNTSLSGAIALNSIVSMATNDDIEIYVYKDDAPLTNITILNWNISANILDLV